MPRTQEIPSIDITILRRRAVERKVGLATSSLYAEIAAGRFPRPVQLSARRVGWIADEVEQWLHQRVAASRPVRLRRRRPSHGRRDAQ